MRLKTNVLLLLCISFLLPSCISKKKHMASQRSLKEQIVENNYQIGKLGKELNACMNKVSECDNDKTKLNGEIKALQAKLELRKEQIADLKAQVKDVQDQRDKQLTQVGDLTVLSQSANDNIKETLSQLEQKDEYIHLLQAAKSKADSINLALAVNLKGVLQQGISDSDVEVKVDKTVVFVNLSDKMLYNSGSYTITSRADEVLGKIAKIIQSRPELEVMVEGYTDNVPINKACVKDNWELSVLRATAVVKALQTKHNVDPNRLIAAGRGQYNTLASNDTYEGRQINRRTRIIILPKLDQFYDLLDPSKVPN